MDKDTTGGPRGGRNHGAGTREGSARDAAAVDPNAVDSNAVDSNAVDLAAVFAALPGVDLVLAPDAPRYTMLAATDGRLAATMTTREATLGRPLFEVFPDANPANDAPSGVGNLQASLDTVLRTRAPHRMAVQRYDLQRPDGTWEERHWAPLNVPVLGPDGAVRYLVHRVEDVTSAVRLAAEGDRLRGVVAGSERARVSAEAARDVVAAAHAQLADAHAQLQAQALELELANQQLQEQAVELEAQVEVADRAAAALRTSEVRFRTVQDASPLGFAIHRPVYGADGAVVDFTVPYVNDAGARVAGQPRARVLAGTLRAVWPGTVEAGLFADYVRVLETGEPLHRELLYEHEELAAGLEITAVRIGAGAEAELGLTFADVTPRLRGARERERLLAESEAARAGADAARAAADLERRRLLATLDQLPVGVHVAEAPSGRLVLDNAALRRIVGEAPASERVADYSAHYAGYRPGPGPEAERRLASDAWPLARALATGELVADELVEVRRADGTRRLVSVSATPVRDAAGQVVGGVAAVTDVTERERLLTAAREAADAERAARAEAEAANQAKSQFLAVMSHELRTPLNAIGGYAELIELGLRGPVTAEQRADLARVQRAQRHLLGLINGVLNYARVEAGAVHYALEDVPLGEVLAACAALVAPQARAKRLALAPAGATPAGGAPSLVARADPEKLRQVVLNLLSNAVKFTAPGGRVALAAEGADGVVRVRVADTGRGIAAEQLARVFEPFVQVDQRLTRTEEGTGLGLAISRDLARGMGGDLTAESAVGVGSTFTLTLPAA